MSTITAARDTQIHPRRARLMSIRERLLVPIKFITGPIAPALLSLRDDTAPRNEAIQLDGVSSFHDVLTQPGLTQAQHLSFPTVQGTSLHPANLPTTGYRHGEDQLDTGARMSDEDLEAQLESQLDPDTPRGSLASIPGWRYRSYYGGLLVALAFVHFIIQALSTSSSSSSGGAVGTIVLAPAQTGGFI